MNPAARPQILLPPRHVRLAPPGALLNAVVSSSAAVALFDPARRRGGMAHWALPFRRGAPSSPVFACPALVGLTRMFQAIGCSTGALQAQLFGGAENETCPRHVPGLSRENVSVGLELLAILGLAVVQREVFGSQGAQGHLRLELGGIPGRRGGAPPGQRLVPEAGIELTHVRSPWGR